MKNEPDYTITISRRYIDGEGEALNVERVIRNAQDGEIIYTSLHEHCSDSEKESPVAHLEKHLGLYPESHSIFNNSCNRCRNFSEFGKFPKHGWIYRLFHRFYFKRKLFKFRK